VTLNRVKKAADLEEKKTQQNQVIAQKMKEEAEAV